MIFGRFSRFNDIFEGHLTFEYQNEQNKPSYQNKETEYVDKMNRIRIYSLASSDDEDYIEHSHLMWAHYADGHTGFCIEFNESVLSDFPLSKTGDANTSIKVEYLDELKYKIIEVDAQQTTENIKRKFANVISQKHKLWEYEQEVRLISKVRDIYPFSPNCNKCDLFGREDRRIYKNRIVKFCTTT